MARNITLALDEETILKARVVAARRGKSVSALLRDEIRRLVESDDRYEAAKTAALNRLNSGNSLGGDALPSREEKHNREELR